MADWRQGTPERPGGRPDEHLYTAERATAELRRFGLTIREAEPLPHRYVLVAGPAGD